MAYNLVDIQESLGYRHLVFSCPYQPNNVSNDYYRQGESGHKNKNNGIFDTSWQKQILSPKQTARCVPLRVMVKIMDFIPLLVCFKANGIAFRNFGGVLFGNVAARFVMNSKLERKRTGPGWMHVLDLPMDGTALGCGMPPPGTLSPLLRYSTRPTQSMLFTDNLGK